MKKKEAWMKAGTTVLARWRGDFGLPGTITQVKGNKVDGVDYVKKIYVKIGGSGFGRPFIPDDVHDFTDGKPADRRFVRKSEKQRLQLFIQAADCVKILEDLQEGVPADEKLYPVLLEEISSWRKEVENA